MRKKKQKNNKTVILATSKPTSIAIMISITLTDADISHKEFTTIINDEKNIIH